jgi:hypothetical protein
VRGPSVWGQHRQRGALVEISPESRVPAASRPRRKELGYSRSVAFASKPLLVRYRPVRAPESGVPCFVKSVKVQLRNTRTLPWRSTAAANSARFSPFLGAAQNRILNRFWDDPL